MHILCPNCAASYQIGVSAIGAAGRSVRCVRCRTVWFQPPVTEPPPLAPSPTAPATREPASEATVAAFQAELGQEIRPPVDGDVEGADSATGPDVPDADLPEAEPVIAEVEETAAAAAPAAAVAAPPEAPAAPAADEPPGAAQPEAAVAADEAPPTAPADADAADPAKDEAPAGDIESRAARRRPVRSNARRKLPRRTGRMMPALVVMLVLACVALVIWRNNIVRHVPQLASLYSAVGLKVNLRGLVFSDVKVSRDAHEGVQVLTVEGVITSVASKPVEIPRLRFAMRNEAGSEVYAWTAMPSRESLGPGESLPFRSRLASPPGDGRDVMVRFFTRLDAIAGLR